MEKALLFETTCITLLLTFGIILLAYGLPGWGIITVAALLLSSSIGMRLVNAGDHRQPAVTAV